jgi:hypothetical protein
VPTDQTQVQLTRLQSILVYQQDLEFNFSGSTLFIAKGENIQVTTFKALHG